MKISYQLSLLAKKLGWEKPTLYKYCLITKDYFPTKQRNITGYSVKCLKFDEDITYNVKILSYCPDIFELQSWLRNNFNIDVEPYLITLEHNNIEREQSLDDKDYSFTIKIKGIKIIEESIDYIESSYELALHKGLSIAIDYYLSKKWTKYKDTFYATKWRKQNKEWLPLSLKISLAILSHSEKTQIDPRLVLISNGFSKVKTDSILKGDFNFDLKTLSKIKKLFLINEKLI